MLISHLRKLLDPISHFPSIWSDQIWEKWLIVMICNHAHQKLFPIIAHPYLLLLIPLYHLQDTY
jgi:hypothetical protein